MTTPNGYPPVTSLGNGEEGIIHAISGDHALISRLAGMGIVLNTRIRFLRASGGLVIVQVADTRVALGASEAVKILVGRLPREEKGPRPQGVALLV
ncbi:MAG: FeoA family protein, partial [Syntrophales bacterium]|nr:FeoA family protein [Syntrophales bacterium]